MKKLRIPSNLTALAYNSIREYILDGHLDENSRLTEEFLAARLGISKSPIREALTRLESEGLIRIEPRRGAYLRTFSLKSTEELYEVREALESHAMRTAKITPAILEKLKRTMAEMNTHLANDDEARYIEEDIRFHSILAQASENSTLCAILENVQNQIRLFRRKTYDLSSSRAPNDHAAIVRELEKGDLLAAERAMRQHIANVRALLIEFLAREAAGRVPSTPGVSEAAPAALPG